MSKFTSRFQELVQYKGIWSENSVELAKLFDEKNVDDIFMLINGHLQWEEETDYANEYSSIYILNELKKIKKLSQNLIDTIAHFHVNKIQNSTDSRDIEIRLRIIAIVANSDDIIVKMYDTLPLITHEIAYELLCGFMQFKNFSYFKLWLHTYLSRIDRNNWCTIHEPIIKYITKEYKESDILDLFQFVTDSILSKNLTPAYYLLDLSERPTNKIIENISHSKKQKEVTNSLEAFVISILNSIDHGDIIYKLEDKLRQSKFFDGIATYLTTRTKMFGANIFKLLCRKNAIFWFHDLSIKYVTIEDIEDLWEAFKTEPYNRWWPIFYDRINYSDRKDKTQLLAELKKHIPEAIKNRNKSIRKNNWEIKKNETKKMLEFQKNIGITIKNINDNPDTFSDWLIYEYHECTVRKGGESYKATVLQNQNIEETIKSQVILFFRKINSKQIELHITRKEKWQTSFTTHAYVANGTLTRCLILAKLMSIDLWAYKDNLVGFVPFCYHDSIEIISSQIWEIDKAGALYLSSVYTNTRWIKDDLKYNNYQNFLRFLSIHLGEFKKYIKRETKQFLFDSILDEKYNYSERLEALELLNKLGDIECLKKIHDKYKKTQSNFFNTTQFDSDRYNNEATEIELCINAAKCLLKTHNNVYGMNWIYQQLFAGKPECYPGDHKPGEVYWISNIESELLWDLDSQSNFIAILEYLDDEQWTKDKIHKLLKYSIRLQGDLKYQAYARYLQWGIYRYYRSRKSKEYKEVLALRKTLDNSKITKKDISYFQHNILNKLEILYADNLTDEQRLLFKELITENTHLQSLREAKKAYDSNIVLFVEWKYDVFYLQSAWEILQRSPEFNSIKRVLENWGNTSLNIIQCYWRSLLEATINNDDIYKWNHDKCFIAIFDFDDAYDNFSSLSPIKWSMLFNVPSEMWKSLTNHLWFAAMLPVPNNNIIRKLVVNENTMEIVEKPAMEIEHLFYWKNPEIDQIIESNLISLNTWNKEAIYNLVRKDSFLQTNLYDNFIQLFTIIDKLVESWSKKQAN